MNQLHNSISCHENQPLTALDLYVASKRIQTFKTVWSVVCCHVNTFLSRLVRWLDSNAASASQDIFVSLLCYANSRTSVFGVGKCIKLEKTPHSADSLDNQWPQQLYRACNNPSTLSVNQPFSECFRYGHAMLLEVERCLEKPCERCLLQIKVSETWSFWGETLRYQIEEENKLKTIIPTYAVFRPAHVEVHQNVGLWEKKATPLGTTDMILTGILLEKEPLKPDLLTGIRNLEPGSYQQHSSPCVCASIEAVLRTVGGKDVRHSEDEAKQPWHQNS